MVVIAAGLGVSALPRYGKQGCLGRILGGSVSTPKPDNYINHLDALDLTRVVMAPYGEHNEARQFERVSLYSGWLRYGHRIVRYLPERVLRQFGRV